MYMHIFLFSF